MTRREKILAVLVVAGSAVAASGVVYSNYVYPSVCNARQATKVTEMPLLVKDLQSFHACVRSAAALDLQSVPNIEAAIPHLLKTAEDRDDSVRWRSVAALGHSGLEWPQIKATAIRHLKDSNQTAVYNSIFALKKFPSTESLLAISEVLNHPWEEVRSRAALDIAWMIDRERDKDIMPTLIARTEALTKDPVEKVRARARKTLAILQDDTIPIPTSSADAWQSAIEEPRLKEPTESYTPDAQFFLREFEHVLKRSKSELEYRKR